MADLHHVFIIGKLWLQMKDLTVFLSFKERCHCNRFWGENCHTQPSFIALTFHNGLEYRNADGSSLTGAMISLYF